MNGTFCMAANTAFDELPVQNKIAATENIYATEPILTIRKPVFQQPDEEELHTSFEEAISDRLLAIHSRLSRLSNPMLNVQYAECNTDTNFSIGVSSTTAAREFVHTLSATDNVEFLTHLTVSWRRATIFACSAMMFMLLGFDLLGLLMLHMH
jgi:hypothetical protein